MITEQQFAEKIRTKFPGAYDGVSDSDLTQKVTEKYPQYKGVVVQQQAQPQQGASLADRTGMAIKAIPSIAKAGVEKVGAGLGDVAGAFKSDTFVAGREDPVSTDSRDLLNRFEQFGQGIQRIGAGALTAAAGVTPIGAGAGAAFGAAAPEVQKLVETGSVQTLMSKFHTLPPDVQEAVVNLAESLPFIPKQAQKALTEGVKQTVRGAEMTGKGAVIAGKKIASLPLDAGANILAKTTSTSAETIKEAFRQSISKSNDFQKALRGEITAEQTLGDVKGALNKVKDSRRALYGEEFAKVEANKTPIDIDDIRNDFLKALSDSKVKVMSGKDGPVLDFSGSKLRKSSQGKVELQDTFDDLMNWEDTTPAGLDILKQRVSEGWRGTPDTGLSDRIHTQFSKKIKEKIISEVPEYEKMSSTYEAISREIEDITTTLSLGRKVNPQTAITKISASLRDNFPFRKDMIELLESYSGKNLKGQLAGQSLSPLLARGLAGVVTGGGVIFGQLLNPAFLSGLALASPRLIGEFANAIGKPFKWTKNALDKAKILNERVPDNVNADTKINPIQGEVVKDAATVSSFTDNATPSQNTLALPSPKAGSPRTEVGSTGVIPLKEKSLSTREAERAVRPAVAKAPVASGVAMSSSDKALVSKLSERQKVAFAGGTKAQQEKALEQLRFRNDVQKGTEKGFAEREKSIDSKIVNKAKKTPEKPLSKAGTASRSTLPKKEVTSKVGGMEKEIQKAVAEGKSFNEFLKSQKIFYHGTSAGAKFKEFKKGGINFFTNNESSADDFGLEKSIDFVKKNKIDETHPMYNVFYRDNGTLKSKIYEAVIDTDGNFLKVDAKKSLWEEIKTPDEMGGRGTKTTDQIARWAKKNNYDGVLFKNIDDGATYNRTIEDHIAVFNTSKVKTKAQLKEAYDKASKKK